MSTAIHVENLSKSFSRTTRAPGFRAALASLVRPRTESVEAVRGVSFSIEAGEKVAFIGPNGAGKSTTIKMLTGILHPTSGQARVLGYVPWTERRKLVAKLGCVFGQRSQLWYHLPVGETFDLLAAIHDLSRSQAAARLAELSDLFELEELLKLPVRKLSLGQRMRCEVAASLLHRPSVVFLDEPTIGLDVVARARIRDLLLRLNEDEGVTVLLTSHDAGDVERVCDRVILVDDGRIVLDTTVDRLRREHLREKRIEAVIEEESVDVRLPGVRQEASGRHQVSLVVDTSVTPVERVILALLQAARVQDVTVSDPSLEEVLQSLYAEGSS